MPRRSIRTRTATPPQYKKGQYIITSCVSAGGDLVAGRVQSVRRDGFVISMNLLTGEPSTRDPSKTLNNRNVICSKAEAMKVVKAYNDAGGQNKETRKAARFIAKETARAIADKILSRTPAAVPSAVRTDMPKPALLTANEVFDAYEKLSGKDQAAFIRKVMFGKGFSRKFERAVQLAANG